jgi:hypothetical protein
MKLSLFFLITLVSCVNGPSSDGLTTGNGNKTDRIILGGGLIADENSFFSCPDNYTYIPSHSSLGTEAFCVSKFEMRCFGEDCKGDVPVKPGAAAMAISLALGTPWVHMTLADAQEACRNIGAGYALITNREWMAVARNIEAVATNWSSGRVGIGFLNRGHVSGPSSCDSKIEFSQEDCVTGGGNFERKRTHQLSAGGTIWDFSGNVYEFVQFEGLSFSECSGTEFPELNCPGIDVVEFMPGNPSGTSPLTYNSAYGLGIFSAGPAPYARGGGHDSHSTKAGIFALNSDINLPNAVTGLRCVKHETP